MASEFDTKTDLMLQKSHGWEVGFRDSSGYWHWEPLRSKRRPGAEKEAPAAAARLMLEEARRHDDESARHSSIANALRQRAERIAALTGEGDQRWRVM